MLWGVPLTCLHTLELGKALNCTQAPCSRCSHGLSAAGSVNAKCQSGYLDVSHFETLAIKRIYMCLCMDSGENPSPFAH